MPQHRLSETPVNIRVNDNSVDRGNQEIATRKNYIFFLNRPLKLKILMIVCATIVVLAAVLVPNLVVALHRSSQHNESPASTVWAFHSRILNILVNKHPHLVNTTTTTTILHSLYLSLLHRSSHAIKRSSHAIKRSSHAIKHSSYAIKHSSHALKHSSIISIRDQQQ